MKEEWIGPLMIRELSNWEIELYHAQNPKEWIRITLVGNIPDRLSKALKLWYENGAHLAMNTKTHDITEFDILKHTMIIVGKFEGEIPKELSG